MRSDVSYVECAAVLFIAVVNEDNKNKTYQLIECTFKSSLLEKQARTYTKDAFAMF
jgi:hypothetical protein